MQTSAPNGVAPIVTLPRAGRKPRAWRPFEQAKEFTRGLGLHSGRQYRAWANGLRPDLPPRPADIPVVPETTYGKQWKGWKDWHGNLGRVHGPRKQWRPFAEARQFVQSLKLTSGKEWRRWVKGQRSDLPAPPADTPNSPYRAYIGLWINWGDWLGSGRVLHRLSGGGAQWQSFEQARDLVHGLALKSGREWEEWCNGKNPTLPPRPADMPKTPWDVYKGQWISMGDWLGQPTLRPGRAYGPWRPFAEARAFAHTLGFKRATDWQAWATGKRPDLPPRPADIPSVVNRAYRRDWVNWSDWIGQSGPVVGRGRRLGQFMTFEEARAFVHTQPLKNWREWHAWRQGKRPDLPAVPDKLPACPAAYYTAEWVSWFDWLGTPVGLHRGGRRGRHMLCSFREARTLALSLKLGSGKDWSRYVQGAPVRTDLPVDPQISYAAQWRGWENFIGPTYVGVVKKCRPFEEARSFVRALHFPNTRTWVRWAKGELRGWPKRPANIPAAPNGSRAYAGQWKGWPDWLGLRARNTSIRVRQAMPFESARTFARSLGLKSKPAMATVGAQQTAGLPSEAPRSSGVAPELPPLRRSVARLAGLAGVCRASGDSSTCRRSGSRCLVTPAPKNVAGENLFTAIAPWAARPARERWGEARTATGWKIPAAAYLMAKTAIDHDPRERISLNRPPSAPIEPGSKFKIDRYGIRQLCRGMPVRIQALTGSAR